MSYIPECEMCFSEEHDGLRQVCSGSESQDVMNVCNTCYTKVICFCDRCEIQVGIVSCILTFLGIKTKFRLCNDCYKLYSHADKEKKEDNSCKECGSGCCDC